MKFRSIVVVLFVCFQAFAQNKYEEYFLEFWNDYNNHYAYFEEQGIDWIKVKTIYQPQAAKVTSDYEFTKLLEKVVNELHNGHVTLQNNFTDSNRIIPSGSDIYAEIKQRRYYIADVRNNSKAQIAGLKPGAELIKFNGKDIFPQLDIFLPKSTNNYTEAMQLYAVNMLFAGKYDTPREITVLENGKEKTYYPDRETTTEDKALLNFKILPGNVGYIKINNCLWNYDLIREFDTALDSLINTRSIILDLTDTPSGGNTTVARAIMGRFTNKELPYQKHVIHEKEYGTVRSWVEYVLPRKTLYKNKLIVMAGYWTGSMGEGMVIGLDAMKRSTTVGTKMAGLLGAIYTFRAKNTNIGYCIPAEEMYHINGIPRENFIPKYLTQNYEQTYQKALMLAGVK